MLRPALAIRLRRLPRRAQLRSFALALRSDARCSAGRAVVDGLWVAVTLRRQGVRPLVQELSGERPATDPDRARRVSDAVDAGLSLLPLAPTCLRRSLTLVRELDRLDLAGTVHVGVRHADLGRVEAHAWVTVDGQVINDDPDLVSTYVELAAGELERLTPTIR